MGIPKNSALRNLAIGTAGFLSLVIANGIGRFAFTPMLPLMQRDGAIDISSGAWLAAANYAGYFAGAVAASCLRVGARELIRFSLLPIAILTVAMGFAGGMLAWLLLRFLAGVLAALVLVGTSAWCLGELAKTGRPFLAGIVYAGVGAGIAIAGTLCLAFAGTAIPASLLWQYHGIIAGGLTTIVWFLIWFASTETASHAAVKTAGEPTTAIREYGLIICYGCVGFGYILPATFIPALGRMVIDDPALFGWAWPIFGVTAALSTILTGTVLNKIPRLAVLSHAYLVLAIGTGLPAISPSIPALLVSAVCVGGTFMVITMAGLQEARARGGSNPTRLIGLMTVAFAIGQMAGPTFSALLAGSALLDEKTSIRAGLLVASMVLTLCGIWLVRASRSGPTAEGARA